MKHRRLFGAGLVAIGVLFVAVFPARTYLDQRHQRQQVTAEIRATDAANKTLQQRVKDLNTDAEVERLAREQYNLVRPGEEAYAILPSRQPLPAANPPNPQKSKAPSDFLGRTWHSITSIF